MLLRTLSNTWWRRLKIISLILDIDWVFLIYIHTCNKNSYKLKLLEIKTFYLNRLTRSILIHKFLQVSDEACNDTKINVKKFYRDIMQFKDTLSSTNKAINRYEIHLIQISTEFVISHKIILSLSISPIQEIKVTLLIAWMLTSWTSI